MHEIGVEMKKYLDNLKVGDKITRMLAGAPMKLKITEIDDKLIHCGWWAFSKITGAEVDEELGWDGITITGSYIKEPEPTPEPTIVMEPEDLSILKKMDKIFGGDLFNEKPENNND